MVTHSVRLRGVCQQTRQDTTQICQTAASKFLPIDNSESTENLTSPICMKYSEQIPRPMNNNDNNDGSKGAESAPTRTAASSWRRGDDTVWIALLFNTLRHRERIGEAASPPRYWTARDEERVPEAPILPNLLNSASADPTMMMFLFHKRGRRLWSLSNTLSPEDESRLVSRAFLLEILQEAVEVSSGPDLGGVGAGTTDGQEDASTEEGDQEQ